MIIGLVTFTGENNVCAVSAMRKTIDNTHLLYLVGFYVENSTVTDSWIAVPEDVKRPRMICLK